MQIPFNKPYLTGNEITYIQEVIHSGKLSSNGLFTKKCHDFFQNNYGLKKCLLTTSCTDALEMSAILLDIKPGDEVIMPSYTFVSTANAFILRGAKIVFADSKKENPNIDENKIEELITKKTKAIVIVHYAGIACEMDKILEISKKHNLFLIEDVAQAIDSFYKNKPLGSFGDLACFSFHETKNIISGEGGMLVVNNESFSKRADIIWEKGTNKIAFKNGLIDKYSWVDIGSSFIASEITAAFLFAQLEALKKISSKRIQIWNKYFEGLQKLEEKNKIKIPQIPEFATYNGHLFYIICKNISERNELINDLKKKNISTAFHYLSLHNSEYFKDKHDGRNLPNADLYSDYLLRLPLFYDLKTEESDYIVNSIIDFYK